MINLKIMIEPYTAIERYLDRTPADLIAPGNELEHSPFVTGIVRGVTSLAAHKIIIGDDEVQRYKDAGVSVVTPPHRTFLELTAISRLGKLSGEGQPYFMSKRENMDTPFSAWLYGKMRTFPIERDMSEDSRWTTMFMKWGRFVLGSDVEQGEQYMKLVLFPEGTRKEGHKVENLLPGATILAKKNKVPLLPMAAVSARARKHHIRPTTVVMVGKPIEPNAIKTISKGTVLLAEKIQEQYDRGLKFLSDLS